MTNNNSRKMRKQTRNSSSSYWQMEIVIKKSDIQVIKNKNPQLRHINTEQIIPNNNHNVHLLFLLSNQMLTNTHSHSSIGFDIYLPRERREREKRQEYFNNISTLLFFIFHTHTHINTSKIPS